MSLQDAQDLYLEIVESDEELIRAVFTTYSFDPVYFDGRLLPQLLKLNIDGELSSRSELLQLAQKLKQTQVAVIADARNNLKRSPTIHGYETLYISGVNQHAKIFLLQYETYFKLIVGSANLTPGGIHTNKECFASFTVRKEDDTASYWHVLKDSLVFLSNLASGQHSTIEKMLGDMSQAVEEFRPMAVAAETTVRFIGSGPGLPPLDLVDIYGAFAAEHATPKKYTFIDSIKIVSPFYEEDATPQGSLLKSTFDSAIEFNARLPKKDRCPLARLWVPTADGHIQTPFPIDAYSALAEQVPEGSVDLHGHPIVDDQSKSRFPHAKIYMIGNADASAVLLGSSNFSTTGFGRKGPRSNWEANIAVFYSGRRRGIKSRLLPARDPIADWQITGPDLYGEVNPDQKRVDPVVVAAEYDDGWLTLTVKVEDPAIFTYQIGRLACNVQWTGKSGTCAVPKLPFHNVSIYNQENGDLIQTFPIQIRDESYQPHKFDVSAEELVGWIENRYLSSRPLPFPGSIDDMDDEALCIHGGAKPASEAGSTELYLVYRVKIFNRLLDRIVSTLEPIKDHPRRLEYHLGQDFGLINCIEKYIEEASDEAKAAIMLYQAIELAAAVARVGSQSGNGEARAVFQKFWKRTQSLIDQHTAPSCLKSQSHTYKSHLAGLSPSVASEECEEVKDDLAS